MTYELCLYYEGIQFHLISPGKIWRLPFQVISFWIQCIRKALHLGHIPSQGKCFCQTL